MSSETNLGSNREPSPARKSGTSPDSGMLTASELESLRQKTKEADAWLREELRKNPALKG